MACGDGEAGRVRANRVNIRCSNGLDAIYQARIDLSRWLELHDVVGICGPGDVYFQEQVTYPKQGRFLKFVQIRIQLIKAHRNAEPDF